MNILKENAKLNNNLFSANIKSGFKYKFKRQIKKMLQPGCLSDKDKGKYVYFKALSQPVKDNHIFYEAFAGLGILDNPRAIFKYIISQPDFDSYTHVWSIDNVDLVKDNIEEFSQFNNVVIVKKDSTQYYQYLATCKYLITNSTFGYFFEKRVEQVYINTWHGVPTKYMGYEHSIERVENGRGPAKNFLVADYVISANRFMTDVMYKRAYKMDGIFSGKLLELGYPRSDSIINPKREYVYDRLNSIGIDTDKKIILYAPTWKGNLYNQLEYNVQEFKDIVEKMSSSIDTNEYRIYLRVHYFLYKILAKDPELEKILIPFTIDTNELLSVVDVLISDYSSIFFDYLPTKRPMIFYVPDLDQYQSGRGLYVPVSKLPGLVSSDLCDIADALNLICKDSDMYMSQYENLLDEMLNWCCYNDDGNACQRIADVIFKHHTLATLKESSENYEFNFSSFSYNSSANVPSASYNSAAGTSCDYRTNSSSTSCNNNVTCADSPMCSLEIINGFPNNKIRTLICINTKYGDDVFYSNLKERLSVIDYENEDVTLLVTSFKDDKFKKFFNDLPEPIRIFVWFALPFVAPDSADFYHHEVLRVLGSTHFDNVIMEGPITDYWANFLNAIVQK